MTVASTAIKEPIEAKGNCFQVHFKKQMIEPEWTLVHGVAIGSGPIEGIAHRHCWLEKTISVGEVEFVMVHDCSNGKDVMMPAALYYMIGQIDLSLCVRYSAKRAQFLAYQTGHFGNWHELPDYVH